MYRKDRQNGSIMVEAALVYPIVIITVVAMLVLSMLKFQENIVQFGAQKFALQAAREASYPNYNEYIGTSYGMEIDLESFPDKVGVENYYDNLNLYRSFGEGKHYGNVEAAYAEKMANFVREYSFINGMDVTSEVNIDGVLSTMTKVETKYSIRLPHFLAYIGLPDSIKMGTKSYSFSSNPTEFVRNVDIAVDVMSFFLDKLGLGDRVDVFLEKLDNIKSKLGD